MDLGRCPATHGDDINWPVARCTRQTGHPDVSRLGFITHIDAHGATWTDHPAPLQIKGMTLAPAVGVQCESRHVGENHDTRCLRVAGHPLPHVDFTGREWPCDCECHSCCVGQDWSCGNCDENHEGEK